MARSARQKFWARFFSGMTDQAGGVDTIFNLLQNLESALQAQLGDITIIRLIGTMLVETTDTVNPIQYDSGITVVGADAFNAGVASVPDPAALADVENWLWVDRLQGPAAVSAGVSPVIIERAFDIRSARKMKLRDILMWRGSNSGSSVVGVGFHTRALVLR